jgi:ADP-ribosylglycohydrolase
MQGMRAQQKNSVLGVLVADAAALGLHWLYDLQRMHQVVADKTPCFLTPNPDHYAGEVGYFAHGGKLAGEQSHYGESYLLNLKHLAAQGKFNTRIFQQKFIATFGPGGSFNGYIDAPTRQSLQNLQGIDLSKEADNEPSGADDKQIPALTPVSALCAAYPAGELTDKVIDSAVRVTNNNDFAVACGLYYSKVLQAVLAGQSIADSFNSASNLAPTEIKEKITEALDMPATDLDAAATFLGQACYLEKTIPLTAYILTNSASYQQAIEMNTLAGGDSCGRAMMLGALAGAFYGIGSDAGIPYSWLLQLKRHQDITALFA